MARRPMYTTIDVKGPFFTTDPGKTFRGNARSMARAFALQGRDDVIAQLRPGEGGRAVISNHVTPVRVSGHVTASIPYTPTGGKRSLSGVIRANVYVPNFGYTKAQGKALMAAYSRVEHETGAFRKTTNRLRRSKRVNVAELLRGVA